MAFTLASPQSNLLLAWCSITYARAFLVCFSTMSRPSSGGLDEKTSCLNNVLPYRKNIHEIKLEVEKRRTLVQFFNLPDLRDFQRALWIEL